MKTDGDPEQNALSLLNDSRHNFRFSPRLFLMLYSLQLDSEKIYHHPGFLFIIVVVMVVVYQEGAHQSSSATARIQVVY